MKQTNLFGDDDERRRRNKRPKKKDHAKEFRRFHQAHPDVFEQIIKHARFLWSHGHRHYGIAAFFENFRWHRRIPDKRDEVEEFKLNNNYKAPYARMLMALYPEFDGFFELRERVKHRRRGMTMSGNPWIDGPEIEAFMKVKRELSDRWLEGKGKGPEPTYPNVRCAHAEHPDEPGYAICRHIVREGAAPHSIELATAEHLGVILCATGPHFGRDLMVVCAGCARGHKWLRT